MYIEWVIAWTTPYLILMFALCSCTLPLIWRHLLIESDIIYSNAEHFFFLYTINVHEYESREFAVRLAMDFYTFFFLFFFYYANSNRCLMLPYATQPTLKVLVYMYRHLIKVNEQVNEKFKNKSMFRKKKTGIKTYFWYALHIKIKFKGI